MDQETLINESSIAADHLSALQPLRQPAPLPPEILVQIFLLSLPPLNLPQAPHKTTLALVCRLWNAIISSTPILWSGISTTDSTTYVQKSLIKSAEHPIDVYGDKNYIEHMEFGSYTSCGGTCCEMLPEFAWHAERWRHVSLMVRRKRFTPSVTSFSSLRSLELASYVEPFYNGPIDEGFFLLLNPANSPHLREVRLEATRIRRWDLIPFSPILSTLELRDISSVCPSVNILLSILATCPKLTVLRLCDLTALQRREEGDKNGYANAPAAVVLPALQELELTRIPNDHFRELLARLDISDECVVSVVHLLDTDSSPETPFLTPALSRHLGRFQHAKVTVAFVRFFFLLIVVGQRWHMEFGPHGARDIRAALEWFSINCNTANSSNVWSESETLEAGSTTFNSPPITLKLGKEDDDDFSPSLLAPIFDCQCISRIEINGPFPHEQSSFLGYISGPQDPHQPSGWRDYRVSDTPGLTEQTTGVWPFPGVSEMVLKGVDAQAILRALLYSIQQRSANGATAGAPQMPVPLKRIEFVDGDWPDWLGKSSDHNEAERTILDILNVLDDDAELLWRGNRISKA